jgi:DNA-binding beta-propeller fold protein YncE
LQAENFSTVYSAGMKTQLRYLILGCSILLSTAAYAASPSMHKPAVLLVVNQGDYTMSVIDPASGQTLGTVATGSPQGHGHEVAVSPDGRTAWVPIYGNSGVGKPGTNGRRILIIDLPSRRATGAITFSRGIRPHLPYYDAQRRQLLVSTELEQSLAIIDPQTRKIIGSIPTGQPESHMFVVSHDDRRAYTANVGPGTVSVLDIPQRRTVAIIPVAPRIQRISISLDDSMVFTSDQIHPELDVIDTRTSTVKTRVPMPATGYGSAATPDGHLLLVALPAANAVGVVDLRRMKMAAAIPVCAKPQEILIEPGNANTAYVSCMGGGAVGVLDIARRVMKRQIAAGAKPDGLGWAASR